MKKIELQNAQAVLGVARAAIQAEVDGFRYHVWVAFNAPGVILSDNSRRKPLLYRNTPKGQAPARVSYLDPQASANVAITEALLEAAPRLIAQARSGLAEIEAKAHAETCRRDAAPALLAALEPLLEAALRQADLDRNTGEQYGPTTETRRAFREAGDRWAALARNAKVAIAQARGETAVTP